MGGFCAEKKANVSNGCGDWFFGWPEIGGPARRGDGRFSSLSGTILRELWTHPLAGPQISDSLFSFYFMALDESLIFGEFDVLLPCQVAG